MLPVIRRTDYRSNRRRRTARILLFLCLFLVCLLVLKECIGRLTRLEDVSGGRFARTFRTDSFALKKRLRTLVPLIAGSNGTSSVELARFQNFHDRFFESFPGYLPYADELRLLISGVKTPLKGVESCAGIFSDFQQTLQRGIQELAGREEFGSALRLLDVMCAHTSMMLNSDEPDILYLTVCSSSAAELGRCALSPAERKRFRSILEGFLANPFPDGNLIRCSLMSSMRDYEKVRLNGFRFFLGEPMASTLFREAFAGRGSLFRPFGILIRDWWYPVDRDQVQALALYEPLLSGRGLPESVPDYAIARREKERLALLFRTRDAALLRIKTLAE